MQEVWRLIRFLSAGASNALIGFATFTLLFVIGLTPQLSLVLTYTLCVTIAYILQSRLVFRPQGRPRYVAFLIVYFIAYFVNVGLLELMMHNAYHPVFAQGLLTFVSAAVSYTGLSIVFLGKLPLLRVSVGPPLGPPQSE